MHRRSFECYRFYGFNVVSELALDTHRCQQNNLDLTIAFADTNSACFATTTNPLYISVTQNLNRQPLLKFYGEKHGYVFHFRDQFDHWFCVNKNTIQCGSENSGIGNQQLLEYFHRSVLAFWLSLNKFLTLHASCVSFGDNAFAFIGPSGAGKSTIAAELIRTGAKLVSDDLFAIGFQNDTIMARASYPQIKLWPDSVAHSQINWRNLDAVSDQKPKRLVPIEYLGKNAFAKRDTSLGAIFLLNRITEDSKIDTDSSHQGAFFQPVGHALKRVLENTHHAVLSHNAFAAKELKKLATLVNVVPVHDLYLPNQLPALHQLASTGELKHILNKGLCN